MRLLSSLLTLCLMSIVWSACTNPAPEPTPDLHATITAQVQEQLAAIPTATPQPAYTPLPTFTPYPTLTPAPTGTPYPTYTPAPTLEPLPTHTPYPSPTVRPTYTPYPTSRPLPTHTPHPTPTPEPTRAPTNEPAWQGTGHWYRDSDFERGMLVVLQDLLPGVEYDVRMASLDADPSRSGDDLHLTLGCLDSLPVGYIFPYNQHIPANVDEYMVGIWDDGRAVWVDHGGERSVILTDDESGAYIVNRALLSEIVGFLKRSSSGLPAGHVLNVILYDSDTDGIDYWSEFDGAGVADALRYLGCH